MIIKNNKYKKVFKPNINKIEYKSTFLRKGLIGLKSLEYKTLSLSEINAIKLYLKRNFKKKMGSFWIRIFPEYYITKKSLNNARMGKGKGSLDKMVIIIKKGQIFLELFLNKKYNLNLNFYKYLIFLLKNCLQKLSIKTKIVLQKK